jgi:hypothetical protein
MAENKPFKFNDDDKNILLVSWKRKSDRAIAAKYIDKVEKLFEDYFISPPPIRVEEKTPQQERDDTQKVSEDRRFSTNNLSIAQEQHAQIHGQC